ncbi:T9SS type A sorting domain-containing protein [Psychroserpens sp. Hel_I_66]|uniref:T9SS type A sorting domain-containing protein n=1 Tax=Psychroserpens sp. Hel_I_66 TaxID=1250004 RepID=UPI000648A202|nr:T9SS type A sorting domain-containing protein [Psychroserpens sp. Hel_I_66]
MKKTTSSKFSEKIAKYGALTAAIAGVADASGQIGYTDIGPPDFVGGANLEYMLDLNNDGVNDFRIYNVNSIYSSYGYNYTLNNLFIEPLAASNEVLGSGGATYAYPFALNNGDSISDGSTGWYNNGFANGYQSLNYGSCDFGDWCNITDGYLGLRFDAGGGNIHYGWARLDVGAGGDVFTIKDYAWNQTVNESIIAGQQTLGIGENALNAIKIVALNKSIGLYNLPEATNYRLVNMTGKEVLNGKTSSEVFVIEANTISNGIYIIELTDANSKAVIRKKVII